MKLKSHFNPSLKEMLMSSHNLFSQAYLTLPPTSLVDIFSSVLVGNGYHWSTVCRLASCGGDTLVTTTAEGEGSVRERVVSEREVVSEKEEGSVRERGVSETDGGQ